MKHTARTLIVAVAVAVLGVPLPRGGTEAQGAPELVASGVVAATESVQDPPGIYGADAELTAVINAAIDRYNTTGLTLDALRFYAHSTDDKCRG